MTTSTQLDLFVDETARDHEATQTIESVSTSTAAHHQIEATGQAATDRARIASMVCRRPGMTAGELARELGWGRDNARVTRRVSELVSDDLRECKYGEARTCLVKGRLMKTVWPV